MSMAGQMHPPFSFWLRQKENGPCTVQKKKALLPSRESAPSIEGHAVNLMVGRKDSTPLPALRA